MRRLSGVYVKRYPLNGMIVSTAVGYDAQFNRRRRFGESHDRAYRVYKNISAASMRRFYRVSKGFMGARTATKFEDYSAIPTDKQMEDINQ